MRRTVICAAVLAAALLTVPAAALAADTTIIVGLNGQKRLDPPDASVGPDDTVTWTYAPNAIKHHIMSDTQTQLEHWDFGEHFSGSFPHLFLNAGAFPYHCALHPQEMHGTITVDRPQLSMGTPGPAGDKFPADLVSFTATAIGTNATITDYQWDYDGDGNFDETTAAPSASHAYAAPGTYQAKVRVTQSDGKTNDATQPVVIFSRTPTASFTATPGTVDKNADVTLNSNASVDHDGSIVTREWDIGDGNGFQAGAATRTANWPTAGTKTVHLRVTDNDGHSSETTQDVTVANHAPTAALTSSSASLPVGGGSVTLDATSSADTDGTVDTFAWDLDGNGTFETPGGTTPTMTTNVTKAGANTIKVRVTDNDGATGDATVTVNVASPPPPPPPPAPTSSTGGSTTSTPTTATKPAASTTPAPSAALKPPSIAAPAPAAAAPLTASGPSGQRLKRQKGVRVTVACGAACTLVATGAVKVKGKRLRLARATAKLGSAGTATMTLKVDRRDLKALRKAKGKAQATITVKATTGASTVTQNVAVSLVS